MWDVGKINIFDLMWDEDLGTRACEVVKQFCSNGWCIHGILMAELGLPCQMRQGLGLCINPADLLLSFSR